MLIEIRQQGGFALPSGDKSEHLALTFWAYQTCYGRQTQTGWRYKQGYPSLGLMKQPRLAGLALRFKGFDFIGVLQG